LEAALRLPLTGPYAADRCLVTSHVPTDGRNRSLAPFV